MSKYSQNGNSNKSRQRVVTEMPPSLVEQVDDWGVPAGMRSRTEAIIRLVKSGLEAEQHAKK